MDDRDAGESDAKLMAAAAAAAAMGEQRAGCARSAAAEPRDASLVGGEPEGAHSGHPVGRRPARNLKRLLGFLMRRPQVAGSGRNGDEPGQQLAHNSNNNGAARYYHNSPAKSFQVDQEERLGFLAMAKRRLGPGRQGDGRSKPASASYSMADEASPLRPPAARAKLARQETSLDESGPELDDFGSSNKRRARGAAVGSSSRKQQEPEPAQGAQVKSDPRGRDKASCLARMLRALQRKRLYVPILLVLLYVAVIYCAPYLKFEPQTLEPWPSIPFNFRDGPLKASNANQFKAIHLFRDQVSGAESVSLDSQGNMYMAIEGGFILYAHLNRSSPIKKSYYEQAQLRQLRQDQLPRLIKIAELNGPRPITSAASGGGNRIRSQRQDTGSSNNNNNNNNNNNHYQASTGPNWRRECQLDEQIYGRQLYTPQMSSQQPEPSNVNATTRAIELSQNFTTKVTLSRCSKPLGIRLSPDEQYLHVIDTMNGLYRINLKISERPYSSQRLVNKLVDFKTNHWIPVVQLDSFDSNDPRDQTVEFQTNWANISFKAMDDLVIDYGAGSKSGDLIYMTAASQNWPAIAFVYQLLEGRSSGLVVRLDTGSNQMIALDPKRMAHVRTTSLQTGDGYSIHFDEQQKATLTGADSSGQAAASGAVMQNHQSTFGQPLNENLINNEGHQQQLLSAHKSLGAPRLDENDIFDDRPLNFPNGIELMDNKQALLIVDTGNKRIIKHYIRGPRRGTSDLWAWTPMLPDNIRRGFDKQRETYWVVGCGRDESTSRINLDALVLLRPWPKIRKFLVKNIYLFGTLVEWFGSNVLDSINLTDFGHAIKIGASFCKSGCTGMMILQYNQNGEIIRSVHSREFPNDLAYYSQVSELIDANEQEHSLYLGSPGYKYVTKLIMPTESYNHPPEHLLNASDNELTW